MALITTERNSQYWEPVATGPIAQIDLSAVSAATGAIPAAVVAGTPFTTSLISADGFKALAAGCELSTAGTIVIQRFVDAGGLVPQGAAVSSTLAANVANSVSVNDGASFQSFTVTITNTGGGSATLSNFVLLLNAN